MPTLGRTLQDLDSGHLRVIAELWGIDPPRGTEAEAVAALARQMLEPGLTAEIAQTLPVACSDALTFLLGRGGRAALAELGLRFGPMRIVGPGRRDREQPWRHPQAALEGLWYRGMIALGFYETTTGPQEFAFIPDDLLAILRPLSPPTSGVVSPSPPPHSIREAGGGADDAVTLLASLRRRPARGDRLTPDRIRYLEKFLIHRESLGLHLALLRDLAVLTPSPLRPDPTRVRELLGATRTGAERRLLEAWKQTSANDLAGVLGLAAPKGEWPNDPATSRNAVLALLDEIHARQWYSLEGLVASVRERHPAFLRPGGDFDSWYLLDSATGRFLRGIEDWDRVDGALLRHTVTGPLYWLGAADLGSPEEGSPPTHFRLRFNLREASPPQSSETLQPSPARLTWDGRLLFPPESSLAQRYQVARFARWVRRDPAGYGYRITPGALAAAASQGLDARRVMALMETASYRPIPPVLRKAITRWADRGVEASLETMLVLRVRDPATLRQLRSDAATSRFVEETLGPTAARIRGRDVAALLTAAARRGLLIEPPEEEWSVVSGQWPVASDQ